MRKNDPRAVFWERTERRGHNECWPWTGGLTGAGYGIVWIVGKVRKATHLSLELHGKPRPGRAHALHSCDNPPCVNPAHLRWGTPMENATDKMARGRFNGNPRKSRNFKATDELVSEVLSSAETGGELSRRLGVSKPVINRIRRAHGVARQTGRAPTMANRVFELMKTVADEHGVVGISQADMARQLGLASSNVSISIRRLTEWGRIAHVGERRYRIA